MSSQLSLSFKLTTKLLRDICHNNRELYTDILVGIATHYGLDGPEIEFRCR